MSDELKVPKRRAQVEVLLAGGGARQVTVFLSEFASTHSGPERLSDLLRAQEPFFAAVDIATDGVVFLQRDNIAVARVDAEWEAEVAPGAARQEVEVTLAGGAQLRGTVRFVLPRGQARLLDFLNDAQPYLRLEEDGRVALVAKRHVARIAPRE